MILNISFLRASLNKPPTTTQSFLPSSIELTTLPNLNLYPLLQSQEIWVGTIRRFVDAADRVVPQRPLHKPADVRHASQVRATSKTATAELGHLLGFKLLQ